MAGLFDMVGKYAAAKGKALVDDILDTLDLDKNGVKDREQWHTWIDSLGSLGGKVDEAIDQEKLMQAVRDGAKTVKEVAAYVEAVKHYSEEEPKKK